MNKWFTGVKTVEELRKKYRELLKKYHPDNESGSVEITQEINAEYDNLAKMYAMDVDAVKKAIPEESLASDIKSRKAVDFVKNNAVIADEKATKKTAEKKETAEKAPAKKPAAKKKADDAEKKPAAKKTTKKKADAE